MSYWSFHDENMKKLKEIYQRVNKTKLEELQRIFNEYNFTFDELNNIANVETKKKFDIEMDLLKQKGILDTQYEMFFGSNNNDISNREILKSMIYGEYMLEQYALKETEQELIRKEVDYYYQEGQKEVNKVKKSKDNTISLSDTLFLEILLQPYSSDFTYEQYTKIITQYNSEQLYSYLIENKLEFNLNDLEKILEKQINQKININGNKISGIIENFILSIDNQAKIEGIKEKAGNNAKVKFIAMEDEKTTPMCQSLNGQVFSINDYNHFYRMYGETANTLINTEFNVKGLVTGLNLPPISHHFHFCRSIIVYYE